MTLTRERIFAALSNLASWADAFEKLVGDFGMVFALRNFSVSFRQFEQLPDWFSQPIGADGAVIVQSLASFRRF
jgi:hypothetical protein